MESQVWRDGGLGGQAAEDAGGREHAAEAAARRGFKDFKWRTGKSWSRKRRVIAKAEWTQGEANPRFIMTSLKRTETGARQLYADIYCARGDMENRIKECQLDLYADREASSSTAITRAADFVAYRPISGI
jgi:hypothetical protein